MIEVKIKGPNAQKRTIIDSLRCQFIKEKDKLYMMRFKSLPNHKRSPRNSVRIDIPSISKVYTDAAYSRVFQNPPKFKEENIKTYLDSSLHQLDPRIHLKLYDQQNHSLENKKMKKNERVKSMASVELQSNKQRRLYRTIQQDCNQKYSHSSLRDYINGFFNLKQSYIKQDKQLVDKITKINAENIQPYKRSKNFKLIALVRKDGAPQNQNQVDELFDGQLSPHICRIQKLQNYDFTGNRNLFKRVKRQKTIQNSLILNRSSQQHDKVSPLKQIKKNRPPSQFKQSLGPWRNDVFDQKTQFKNDSMKDFLS